MAGTMLARRTQTNEPARCATLLPLLAALPQPLALIEVGASAGLCLYPDGYHYRYQADGAGGRHDVGPDASPVSLACRTAGPVPLPHAVPTVVWRAGVDLNPLDVSDPDDARWLECLVWPEQTDRLHRLRAAMGVARGEPTHLVRGDLNETIRTFLAEVPAGATPVVFHSAVLAYLSEPDRIAFARTVRALPGHWISNEAPSVLPTVRQRVRRRTAPCSPSHWTSGRSPSPRRTARGWTGWADGRPPGDGRTLTGLGRPGGRADQWPSGDIADFPCARQASYADVKVVRAMAPTHPVSAAGWTRAGGRVRDGHMRIGEAAERTGLSLRTLRYYEEVGLVVPSARSRGGFRLYTEPDLRRLRLVRQMKGLDFSLHQMQELLDTLARIDGGSTRTELTERVAGYLDAVRSRCDALCDQLAGARQFAADLERRLPPPR